jgi:uncharacterized protein (DUF58 family)
VKHHRPLPAADRPATGRWRELTRVITPLGWGMLAVGLAALLAGGFLHWQEFLQLGAVALGLVILAIAWVLLPASTRVGLTCEPARITEGGPAAEALLTLSAGGFPALSPRLKVPVGEASVTVRAPFLAPYQSGMATARLPALRRGAHQVGPVRQIKRDPFGLAERAMIDGSPSLLLVRPVVTDLSLLAGGGMSDLDGAVSEELSMSDLAFQALREYVPGDDLRHVHWRSSAKAGQLLTRQYHETRRGHVTIMVDQTSSSYADEEDFELAVSIGTSIALRAARDDLDTYLRCGDDVARGRVALAFLDIACHFHRTELDGHSSVVGSTVGTAPVTGMVVQVTGSRRPVADLLASARLFPKSAQALIVRAERGCQPRFVGRSGVREMSVPDLGHLPGLLRAAAR